MSYRVVKLPLTTARTGTSRGRTLVRLSRKGGRIPGSSLGKFHTLARSLARRQLVPDAAYHSRATEWVKRVTRKRRYLQSLNDLHAGSAFGVVVPLLKGVSAPRMDEALRVLAGLELAERLRARKLGKVVVALWPVHEIGQWGETGLSAVVQRGGDLEDVAFRAGEDLDQYIKGLHKRLPGTGFSSLLVDQMARCKDADPDVFKLKMLLKWFDGEGLTVLPPTEEYNYELNLRVLFKRMNLVATVGSGSLVAGMPVGEPLPFSGISATFIEGKVEGWLSKFSLGVDEVLAGEVDPDALSARNLPDDVHAVFNHAKERALSALVQFEMGLNDLGFRPDNDLKKLLTNADIGFDKLRHRAVTEAERESGINRNQLAKLHQYLLPDGRPQQEVISLLHYLNFYGPEFLDGLVASLQFDDVRHQAVYLAEEDEQD
jgi:hypothetical protein